MSKEAYEVVKEYDTDKYGLITDPGKFEGEPVYTVYFYELNLMGEGEYHASLEYGDGDECGSQFEIIQEDVERFPELEGNKYVSIYEDCLGFVHCELHDDDRT